MANKAEHDLIGLLIGAGISLFNKDGASQLAINPISGALVGKYMSRVPDLLEPAYHPNHRAFFHSWTCLGLLGFGMYKTWKWETHETDKDILCPSSNDLRIHWPIS